MSDKVDINKDSKEYSQSEIVALKFEFLKKKIFENFDKGAKILKIAKITVAVAFVLFTICGAVVSKTTISQMRWLQLWIIVIFANVLIFVIADYSKYLVESKVVPYLKNDEQVEFGEYDIFLEDIDGESDDEEEEEEE